MFCSRCGSRIAEGNRFCPACGESVQPVARNNFSVNDEPTIFAGSLGDEPTEMNEPVRFDRPPVYPENYNVMQGANNGYYPSDAGDVKSGSGKKKEKKKKKKGPKKIILSIIAVLLTLVIVSGSAFGIFYATNPEFQLAWAIERTVLESKGFDFNFLISEEWTHGKSSISVDGIVDLGENTEKSNLYFTANFSSVREGYYDDDYYDWETDSYIEYYVEPYDDFETYYGAIFDGKGIVGGIEGENNTAYEGIFFSGTTENLLKELETICNETEDIRDGMNEYADISVSEAFRMAKELISKENVNKDVIKELFDGSLAYFMDEQFNADMFTYNETIKLIADFFISGITEEAFEITDTYNEDGVKMRDVRVDLNELVVCLKDFIDDNDDLAELLDDIDEDIYEVLEEIERDDEEDFEEDFKFTIGTKNGYFCYFSSDFFDEFDVELSITNINNPTDVSSYYKDIEAIAKEWNENFFNVKTYDDVMNAMDTYRKNR